MLCVDTSPGDGVRERKRQPVSGVTDKRSDITSGLPVRRGNDFFEEKDMTIIEKIEREQMRLDIPAFKPGDAVKVHFRIVEGEKERIQVFQGNVIRMHRGTVGATVTVRKVSDGVGVERIFPLHSPFIDHIELVTEGSVRRSRLYYLRDLKGKAARIKPKKRY